MAKVVHQKDVLKLLKNKGRPMKIKQIADELGMSYRTIWKKCKQLHRYGFIKGNGNERATAFFI